MRPAAIILLLLLSACGSSRPAGPTQPAPTDGTALAPMDPAAFAPVSLRIHPLTHVEPWPGHAGRCLLVLHFELKDRFGDAVKGLGRLQAQLYKPGAGVTPGIETQELTWDVPGMDAAQTNSDRFDQATRSYRVPLGAPMWVHDWLNKTDKASPGWVKVRVSLTVLGPDGQPKFLTDEFIVQK